MENKISQQSQLRTMTVEKLKDDKFDGKHPNSIVEGYAKTGQVIVFEVGKSLLMPTFITSPIIEIDEEKGIFKTQNSTYKFKWLNL